ncbi:hypothetical protein FisN_11Lh093 [Fistulifera solaris]|uniref:Poly(A) RNA polymerase mitochondrial-like central palm domain-containing protein n=1 Tax=Fistulifera solaris TaxID=1519565 RepID=A0A1Z5J7N4_FISSO|nr:hypothetical protein FisN_11Lh093 [Fistulifera solaris]|eukprot:GAX09922.1 hypothetical protein FisN_11Lh093 [Fistulifera solaris]
MERLPPSTSDPHVLKTASITENESFRNGENEVRDWIEALDARERSCALAFVDESFLTALLSFASWSLSPSTAKGGPSNQIDWTATVDVDAFSESMLGRPHEILLSVSSAEDGNVEAKDEFDKSTKATHATIEETGRELIDSNALRIPRNKNARELALSDFNLISRVINKAYLVFPAVFRHFDAEFGDEKSPAIVVTHDDKSEWQQALNAFDEVFTHFFGSGFLINVDLSQTSIETLLFLRLEHLKKVNNFVPLALIFLVRLEVAAILSFKDEFHSSHDPTTRLRKPLSRLLFTTTMLASNTQINCSLASFLSAFCIPSDSSIDITSLWLTPLSYLSYVERNNMKYDWVALDNAIGLSLNQVEAPNPADDEVCIRSEGTGTESKEAQIIDVQNATSESHDNLSIHLKKKRKSRKRKGGKKSSHSEKHSIETIDVEVERGIKEVVVTMAGTPPIDSESLVIKPIFSPHIVSDEVLPHLNQSISISSEDTDQSLSAKDDAGNKDTSAAVGVPVPAPIAAPESHPSQTARNAEIEEDDEDAWERVEVRGRGNRRKGSDQQIPVKNRPHSGGPETSGLKKAKGPRSVASRKKVANRKVAKDILSSVLDKVADEVQVKKATSSKQADNPWKVTSNVLSNRSEPKVLSHVQSRKMTPPREKTMRDVLLGAQERTICEKQPSGVQNNSSPNKDQVGRTKLASSKVDKDISAATLADQNTAPTYQETVSAVSTPSNVATKQNQNSSEERISKSDSSSVDETSETALSNGRQSTQPKPGTSSDNPPLPTLLNPDNANSTTSSVASSLEIPSGCHRHHAGTGDVNDVGYHLLDVCDQLSRDMCLFMSRRALALGARRRERGAILYALQDVLSKIWPNSCHVEMYGSCATQLDLPSSDLDVVIMGLDRTQNMIIHAAPPIPEIPSSPLVHKVRPVKASMNATSGTSNLKPQALVKQHQVPSYPSFIPLPLQSNADRVLRLAAELELQPWAVQVNAIPTASVPVVKVLCDPSRLVGGTISGDWMTHHQHLATDAAAAAGQSLKDVNKDKDSRSKQQLHSPPQPMLSWRGSDVMNGLLKLDITFEGPEHGGIGSTQFSARVVNDACLQANVAPDATPLVQVVMVLKELLVQRKLNEPYSGGLSSYALLLLVVALLREREVIRKEIERVELQRKAMAQGDATVAFANTGAVGRSEGVMPGASKAECWTHMEVGQQVMKSAESRSGKVKTDASLGSQVPKLSANYVKSKTETIGTTTTVLSSWASVAKKVPRQSSSRQLESAGKIAGDTAAAIREAPFKEKTIATFADAVSKTVAPTVTAKINGVDLKSKRNGSHPVSDVAQPAQQDDKRTRTLAPANGADSSVRSNSKDEESKSKKHPKSEVVSVDPSIIQGSYFAQGFNDIVEVLCSGETTAGKLLMHFLLYYGQHFDAQSTAIDISGKHERPFSNHVFPYAHISPYIQRRAHGTIDPVTGMLTVDPIVIFDPLEGAENTNVARRCFAWLSVRWIFAQSYNTLSSAVERSASPSTPGAKHTAETRGDTNDTKPRASSTVTSDVSNDTTDPQSPLLRCLLSF